MNRSRLKKGILSVALALFVNLLLFVWIPLLSRDREVEVRTLASDPIRLTEHRPSRPDSPEAPPRRTLPETTPPEPVPEVSVPEEPLEVREPEPQLETPSFDVEIDPQVETKLEVSPPPKPKPKSKPKPKPKPKKKPKPKPKREPSPPKPAKPSPEPPTRTAKTSPGSESAAKASEGQSEAKSQLTAVPKEFGLDEVDRRPRILRKVKPPYPRMAHRRNIDGKVLVKFLVDPQGRVKRPSVVRADPKGIFEDSVLETIRKWRFKPGYYRGKAVSTWVVLPIQFRLD